MEEHGNISPSLRNKVKQTQCTSCCFPCNNHHRREALENKCRDLINRIGRRNNRRHCAMTDFKYDPLSYALNFDEGGFHNDEYFERLDEVAPLRRSSARVSALPAPLKTAAKAGITCG